MRGAELLLILGALQSFVSQRIHVYQIPEVTVSEDTTVTLQCNYTLSNMENATLGWATWYKHTLRGPKVSNIDGEFIGRVSQAAQNDFTERRSAGIQLHRAQLSDSGIYICQVSFSLKNDVSGHGNGTFLIVTGGSITNSVK
ncbi:hypothetical protein XELAEV_18023774mg [Xenopus laevis]|uniref:Natural cytotoxicity triggering receptor 3 n=1 Tax=Xenopus laevis TaxID=8355 RepID=A0A974D520_XENLA|nr:hypothetical protein XELAEV_18023774mg [Xenopus laevis]